MQNIQIKLLPSLPTWNNLVPLWCWVWGTGSPTWWSSWRNKGCNQWIKNITRTSPPASPIPTPIPSCFGSWNETGIQLSSGWPWTISWSSPLRSHVNKYSLLAGWQIHGNATGSTASWWKLYKSSSSLSRRSAQISSGGQCRNRRCFTMRIAVRFSPLQYQDMMVAWSMRCWKLSWQRKGKGYHIMFNSFSIVQNSVILSQTPVLSDLSVDIPVVWLCLLCGVWCKSLLTLVPTWTLS